MDPALSVMGCLLELFRHFPVSRILCDFIIPGKHNLSFNPHVTSPAPQRLNLHSRQMHLCFLQWQRLVRRLPDNYPSVCAVCLPAQNLQDTHAHAHTQRAQGLSSSCLHLHPLFTPSASVCTCTYVRHCTHTHTHTHTSHITHWGVLRR